MKPGRTRTNGTVAFAVIMIVVQLVVNAPEINAMPYQSSLRLCSKGLGDMLALICKDRGFNEPFSYSGEVTYEEERRPPSTTGYRRGLVQECCHRSCSVEHLERYCKPLPAPQLVRQEDAAVVGNGIGSKIADVTPTYKIISLPFSSVKEFQIARETVATISPEHRTVRARASRRKRRKKGRRKYPKKTRKSCKCHRHRRPLNKNWRKVSRETMIPEVPAFQVGTTSPEPIETIVIFPFKSELNFEHVDGNVQGQDGKVLHRSR